MIALKETQEPEFFNSERITRTLDKAREAIEAGRKPKLPDIWSEDDDARRAQHGRHHNGKCCYCERKRDIKLERDVEHFRPKLKVKEAPDHGGYWWLAYEWNNLLISCKTCNTIHKGNHFPLREGSERVEAEGRIDTEDALLINPAIENPEDYFIYATEKRVEGYLTKIIPSEEDVERSQKTIQILDLNRSELLGGDERSESYKRIIETIHNYIGWKKLLEFYVAGGGREEQINLFLDKIKEIENCIKEEIRPTKTYAGFRRYLVRISEQDELVELLNEN